MPQLLINAVSCKAGGGVNDLTHTLPLLDECLSTQGWNVHTWVVDAGWDALEKTSYPMDRITRVNASSPIKRAAWEFIRFPRIVRRRKPAVVFQFSNFIFRELAVPQITVLRSPTFFSDQYAASRRTGWYQSFRYRAGCHFSAATIRRAASVFCISDTHRQDILRTVGPNAQKVRVSYLGFAGPDEALRRAMPDPESALTQLPPQPRDAIAPFVNAHRKIVVNVAHYYEHKNLGDLLDAVQILRRDHPDICLVMTAGLTQYKGPRNARTDHDTQLACKLSEEGVLVDLGPVPKEWVWPLLALADVFAFPSSLESFGHPLLEAMSMGVPVVAADTPIHREIAQDAALYHEPGNASILAAQIEASRQKSGEQMEMVQRGKQRASAFNWEEHAETLCSAIVDAAK